MEIGIRVPTVVLEEVLEQVCVPVMKRMVAAVAAIQVVAVAHAELVPEVVADVFSLVPMYRRA